MAAIKDVNDAYFGRINTKPSWNHIYIIKCHDYYKIGYTHNVLNRLQGLQVSNPYDLELIFCKKIPEAKYFEKWIHWALAKGKIRGEWFKVDIITLSFLISELNQVAIDYAQKCLPLHDTQA